MRRTAVLFLLAASLLLGCSKGTAKYNPPPKHYPILYTYSSDLDLVWDATLKALAELKFEVTAADRATGKIETGWTSTGYAPSRSCKYGFVRYVENPLRREKLTIEVKSAPLAPPPPVYQPPPAPGGFPGFPGAAPPAQPGYPPAQPGYPPAQPGYPYPGYPAYPGSPGDVGEVLLAQLGFPPPMGGMAAPVAGGSGVMVLVKSKGESVLEQECGGEPKIIDLTSDTSTEYKLLYTIGAKLGQRMEKPAY